MYNLHWKGAQAVVNQRERGEPRQPDATFHYPPELLSLLIETIPRLCRAKDDVLLFFRGAGVDRSVISRQQARLNANRDSINKFDIARQILTQLNEEGDSSLEPRREVLKRVVEFEEFSTCWESDRLPAEGLVARIRELVNVKDSFTRMSQERKEEARTRREARRTELEEMQRRKEILEDIKRDFFRLFSMDDAQRRGLLLESVLNRLFKAGEILIREAFTRSGEPGEGVVEQIDGVVDIDGHLYLVEMKWLSKSTGKGDVAQHLVRLFNRGECRGIFISYTDYTPAAIAECRDALTNIVVVLSTLQEIVSLLDAEGDLKGLFRSKNRSAIIDKRPFTSVEGVAS